MGKAEIFQVNEDMHFVCLFFLPNRADAALAELFFARILHFEDHTVYTSMLTNGCVNNYYKWRAEGRDTS